MCRDVYSVKLREHRHEPFAEPASHRGLIQQLRRLISNDDAVAALHDVEDRPTTDTSSQNVRAGRAETPDARLTAIETRAMSCAVGGTGPSGGRSTTSSVAESDQVGEVGVPTRKLRDFHRADRSRFGMSHAGSPRSHASIRAQSSRSVSRTARVSATLMFR